LTTVGQRFATSAPEAGRDQPWNEPTICNERRGQAPHAGDGRPQRAASSGESTCGQAFRGFGLHQHQARW